MPEREYTVVHNIIAFPALFAMVFYLSSSVFLPIIECADTCLCGCNIEEYKEINNSSNCCAAQVVTVSGDCCNNEHLHETHFTFFVYKDDSSWVLHTYNLGSTIFTELYSIVWEKQSTPVDIVYAIFKPPSV